MFVQLNISDVVLVEKVDARVCFMEKKIKSLSLTKEIESKLLSA